MNRLLPIYFLLLMNVVEAQTAKIQDTLYCNYLGQELGLLQLNVKEMALDDLGYLWAATEDGLHRFNSYTFKPYTHNPNDSTSIKDDHIRSLYFTKDTLWLATNTKGITGFIPSKNHFFDLELFNKNADFNTGYKVLKLTERLLLFSVKNHAIIYNRFNNKKTLIPLPSSKKESYITDVTQIDTTRFWLGTSSLGILILDTNTSQIIQTPFLKTNQDLCFHKLNKTIYIGSKNGLFVYNSNSNELKKTPINLAVNCFFPIDEHQFYLGTKSGLYHYNINTQKTTLITLITKDQRAYKTLDINHIKNDTKGNLWIGTEAEGIFHYNTYQKKFNTLNLKLKEYPLKNNISTFQYLKGKDSTLWIGSNYGVVKYSHITEQFQFYKNKETPLIYAMSRDNSNTIWAGGFTTGLLKYDPKDDRFEKISSPKNTLTNSDVIEIIPIDNNTLWVCTWAGGIHEFDITTDVFEEVLINGERLNRTRTSLIDKKGNIWLGTDQGAYKISKNNVVTRYQAEDSISKKLSSHRVFNIKEDNKGNIWFGTNAGLTKLDLGTENTTLYYKQKGLPNDFIYGILIDNNNHVWVSTNYGISVLNTQTNSFTNYTVSDGLQNNEFNGKACYKDEFGNFYFGGISGINIFKPENIIGNPYLPNTYIESVELFNQPLNKNELFRDQLEFKSHENVITFKFAAINYLNPEKCIYTYKMEGFDTDWRPITANRSTTYTNLDPGNYTFKVKATNDVGKWNEIPKTLSLIITPPWYETSAFKFSTVFFLILSIGLFYLYKTRKLKNDKIKLESIVKARTKEIHKKSEDLQMAYKEADKQRTNISFLMRELTHRVKNNLQIISSLLNIQATHLENNSAVEALKVAKNRILTISHIENKIANDKESIKIDDFIRDLGNSIIGALSDDENLKFKINYELEEAIIKNVNTTLIGLMLNELITNTTKYAFEDYHPENCLKISCFISSNTLKLIVKDNGKGYNKDNFSDSKSLGIELVSEMVEQLNGTLQIKTSNGVENIINIPI